MPDLPTLIMAAANHRFAMHAEAIRERFREQEAIAEAKAEGGSISDKGWHKRHHAEQLARAADAVYEALVEMASAG